MSGCVTEGWLYHTSNGQRRLKRQVEPSKANIAEFLTADLYSAT
jgi:hypothetical protein